MSDIEVQVHKVIRKKRHRFQKVAERVENLRTELQLHVKTNAIREPILFREELQIQGEMITIESFQLLYRTLLPLVTTTPQLLHHLPRIVALLLEELNQKDTKDQIILRERTTPIFHLFVALVREIGHEFYPYFAQVLPSIIATIDVTNPELSTEAFKCLTMLFHCLRVELLADMGAMHKCYFPLLSHPKQFVREFAAQTLAVLLRRSPKTKNLLHYLHGFISAIANGSACDNECLLDGSARLIFAIVRNVNHSFHSRMEEIFTFLLQDMRPQSKDVTQEHSGEYSVLASKILSLSIQYIIDHVEPTSVTSVLNCLQQVLKDILNDPVVDVDGNQGWYIGKLLSFVNSITSYRKCKLVNENPEGKSILANISKCIWQANRHDEFKMLHSSNELLQTELLAFFQCTWYLKIEDPSATVIRQVKLVFQATHDVANDNPKKICWRNKVFDMIQEILQKSHVDYLFLKDYLFPQIYSFGFDVVLPSNSIEFAVLIDQLASWLAKHYNNDSANVFFAKNKYLDGYQLKCDNKDWEELLYKTTIHHMDTSTVEVVWQWSKAMRLISCSIQTHKKLEAIIDKKIRDLVKSDSPSRVLSAELWHLQLKLMCNISKNQKNIVNEIIVVVEQYESSISYLSAATSLLASNIIGLQYLPANKFESMSNKLEKNLKSPVAKLREKTLELLATNFESLPFMPSDNMDDAQHSSDNDVFTGLCDLLNICLEIEKLCENPWVDIEREIIRLLNQVLIYLRSSQTPTVYKTVAFSHLLGLYHVKFSTIWPTITQVIQSIMKDAISNSLPITERYWQIIYTELKYAIDKEDFQDKQDGVSHTELNLKTADDKRQEPRANYNRLCDLENNNMPFRSSTDALTHHNLLWGCLRGFSQFIESKTRHVMPMILEFLKVQFSRVFVDDLSQTQLEMIDTALENVGYEALDGRNEIRATRKAVRSKLIDIFELLTRFTNLRGCYGKDFLRLFCKDMIMKTDEHLGGLALQCLYGLEPKALSIYRGSLDRLASSSTFRDELACFHSHPKPQSNSQSLMDNTILSKDKGQTTVALEHQKIVFPVLLRLLYAKCGHQKAKNNRSNSNTHDSSHSRLNNSVNARRVAVLAYLADFPVEDILEFMELAVQNFGLNFDNINMNDMSPSLTNINLEGVSVSRAMGFLNLLETLIEQLPRTILQPYLPVFLDIVVHLLEIGMQAENAEPVDEGGDNSGIENEGVKLSNLKLGDRISLGIKKQLRTLSYHRLTEIVDKVDFDDAPCFKPWIDFALETSSLHISQLKNTLIGATKPSALLSFLATVARSHHARTSLTDDITIDVIKCLSSGLPARETPSEEVRSTSVVGINHLILDTILLFINALIDEGEEEINVSISKSHPFLKFVPVVLNEFVYRFQYKADRLIRRESIGSSRKELAFLCRIAPLLTHSCSLNTNINGESESEKLFSLLLPYLQSLNATAAQDIENLLKILAQLIPNIRDPKRHIFTLAKSFAPGTHCITERESRHQLVLVFKAIASHRVFMQSGDESEKIKIQEVTQILEDMNAVDSHRLEEIDFDRRMQALQSLDSLEFLSTFTKELYILAPLVAQLLQSLHESEFSLRSAAYAALSCLFTLTSTKLKSKLIKNEKEPLVFVLQTFIMPTIKLSLKSTNEAIRKGFIMLLSRLSKDKELHSIDCVPSDLALLQFYNKNSTKDEEISFNEQNLGDEEIETDFFYNITHIQAHRRRRALQRLTELMKTMSFQNENQTNHDQHRVSHASKSLTNSTVNHFILPLLLHFIYEPLSSVRKISGPKHGKNHSQNQQQSNSSDSLQLESAQCIGVASNLLGWSNYVGLLKTLLKSIDTHSNVDGAIIATVCAIIDNFHFVSDNNDSGVSQLASSQNAQSGSKMHMTLETQILPLLQASLFKKINDKKEKSKALSAAIATQTLATIGDDSNKGGLVRVPMALAIVKVLRRVRPAVFEVEFPKLLLSFCKLLKNREEKIRFAARSTLVKISKEMGIKYLFSIIRELESTLRDGYKVYVLSYTVYALLEEVAKSEELAELLNHQKPHPLKPLSGKAMEPLLDVLESSPVDQCVDFIMKILVTDLFRTVSDESNGANSMNAENEQKSKMSKMKEAKGSKALESLEMLSSFITFLPNDSIHRMVSNLIMGYNNCMGEKSAGLKSGSSKAATLILQSAMESMARGLLRNPSVEDSYLLVYVYNIMHASVTSLKPPKINIEEGEEGEDEAPNAKRQKVISTRPSSTTTKSRKRIRTQSAQIVSWLVNEKTLEATTALAARVNANEAAKIVHQPRMTGIFQRQPDLKLTAGAVANQEISSLYHMEELVVFGLYLLFQHTRKHSSTTSSSLINPFIPLLLQCIRDIKNNDRVAVLALKCLSVLLRCEELPSLSTGTLQLVTQCLHLLQAAGASTKNELVATVYRTLTAIMNYRTGPSGIKFSESQLRVILSFVRADLDEKDHVNATFGLLKAVISMKVVMMEIYDVMDRVKEILFQSTSAAARTHCSNIFQIFVLEYPMGVKKLTSQLNFLLTNLTYIYESGRLSCLETLRQLIGKLPQDFINSHMQLIFLPLVLRMANEESTNCRSILIQVLESLIRRSGNKELNETILLVVKWWKDAGSCNPTDAPTEKLILGSTTAQISSIIMRNRPEFMEKYLIQILHISFNKLLLNFGVAALKVQSVEPTDVAWQLSCHTLQFVQAVSESLPGKIENFLLQNDDNDILEKILLPLCVDFPHPLVRLSALEIIKAYLRRRNPLTLHYIKQLKYVDSFQSKKVKGDEYLSKDYKLFHIASTICNKTMDVKNISRLNNMSTDYSECVIQILSFLLSALIANPNIQQYIEAKSMQQISDDKDIDSEVMNDKMNTPNPVSWLITRLSYLGRQESLILQTMVFKLFAYIIHSQDSEFVEMYTLHMINPLYRSITRSDEDKSGLPPTLTASEMQDVKVLAQEVLERLERKVGSTVYLTQYTKVQQQLQKLREQRKQIRKHEVLTNPEKAAARKLHKNLQKRTSNQLKKKRKYDKLNGRAISGDAHKKRTKIIRPGAG